MSDLPDTPPQAEIRPPMAALVTVAIGGRPVTTVRVEADRRLGVYCERRDEYDGNEWPAYEPTADTPEPTDRYPAEVHGETRVPAHSWLYVAVDDERVAQVSAAENERVTLHAEPASTPAPSDEAETDDAVDDQRDEATETTP